MKKLFIVSMIVILIFSFVGCSNEPVEEPNNENEEVNSDNEESNNEIEDEEADVFPEKPIEMIVPYGAGGSTDTTARTLAKVMNKYLPNNENVVIVNKPGGSGTIGLTELLNSDNDGYTIGLTPSGALSLQPLYGNTSYNYDSFEPIIRISSSPILLLVQDDAPWDTVEEWIEYVEANPGSFTYGSSGKGNPGNIAMEILNEGLEVNTRQIAYDGQSDVFADLLGGHIDGATGSAQQGKSHIEEGNMRVLLNLGSTKGNFYEDAPMLKDYGVETTTDVYFGIIAPPGIPEERADILHEAFKKALEDPEVIEQYEAAGIEINYADSEEFGKMINKVSNSAERVLKNLELIE